MNIDYFRKTFIYPPVRYTDRLILRAVETKDAADMYEYSCDPDVTKYLTWEPHRDIHFTKQYIKRVISSYRNGRFYDFAVELKCSGKMIGTAGFTSFNENESSLEIGYVFNPRYHGYSLASEAASHIIAYAFEAFSADSVFARCMPENHASRRVMEKCGMTFECLRERSVVKQNRYYDVLQYRITREEYEAHKQTDNCGI